MTGAGTSAEQRETVFTYGSPQLKFGSGAAEEIGWELASRGATRVLVITDPGVAATGAPHRVAEGITAYGINAEIFDGVHVEPTDASLRAAVDYAKESGPWDAFVAVGGGSSIDTAKAVDLLTTNDGELADYLNPPVGAGRAPTTPLRPLVAVPTTTGTGAESTTVCVLDVLDLRVKTGISHSWLRPALAVVDPELTLSQPPEVTAAVGMDVLCHALESYTARPYTSYPRKRPEQRVPYCGANPISDVWCEQALRLLGGALRTAVRRPEDAEARGRMALAATMAGLGFGNAGVHIPHANAYPIAGRVREFRPAGYVGDEPLVPHGMAVSLTAPEAFRFTFEADPGRHLRALALLTEAAEPADVVAGIDEAAPAARLPLAIGALMRDIGMPAGLGAIGYDEHDVTGLVEGALHQQRLLSTAPREVGATELADIIARSIEPRW
jgi:alcohol dehydrogenase class IV